MQYIVSTSDIWWHSIDVIVTYQTAVMDVDKKGWKCRTIKCRTLNEKRLRLAVTPGSLSPILPQQTHNFLEFVLKTGSFWKQVSVHERAATKFSARLVLGRPIPEKTGVRRCPRSAKERERNDSAVWGVATRHSPEKTSHPARPLGDASYRHQRASLSVHTAPRTVNVTGLVEVQSTQDAGRDACTNSNVFPLMLLACSVDTPIHINWSHLLALRARVLCGWGLNTGMCCHLRQMSFLLQSLRYCFPCSVRAKKFSPLDETSKENEKTNISRKIKFFVLQVKCENMTKEMFQHLHLILNGPYPGPHQHVFLPNLQTLVKPPKIQSHTSFQNRNKFQQQQQVIEIWKKNSTS